MTEIVNKSRLLWSCRRGMLELDTLFMPYVDEVYDGLPEGEKLIFQRLLDCQDPLLFSWFMGNTSCPDPQLAKMVKAILQYAKP